MKKKNLSLSISSSFQDPEIEKKSDLENLPSYLDPTTLVEKIKMSDNKDNLLKGIHDYFDGSNSQSDISYEW